MGSPSGRAETFRIFDEIWIGQVAGDQPVAELLLLNSTDIAKCAINKYKRDQWDAVPDCGGEFIAGIEKSAIAVDRKDRDVGSRMLRAECGRIAPTEIILIAG